MRLVLDSSATLAWIHPEERTPALEAVFDGIVEDGAIVPRLWHLEIAHSLTKAARRKRTSPQFRDAALADLQQFDIVVDAETELHAWQATVQLADTHHLSVYDASYLELAQRSKLPLATLDKSLARAAISAGVEVLPTPSSD